MKHILFLILCLSSFTVFAQEDTTERVFVKVQVEPQFDGGNNGWRLFLQNNLKASVPVDNGAKPGMYTVVVQFIVKQDGTVSDIKPLTQHGYGMEAEVVRLLEKSPRWIPAKQNGRTVAAYKKQPVTFVVSEG
jgi:periplasmic protein TonB